MGKFLATAWIALLSCASPLFAEALSKAQIKTELVDRAFAYQGQESGRYLEGTIAYRSDGKIFILTSENYVDAGTWTVKTGMLCTRIILLRNGSETCFKVFANGATYYTSHGFTLSPLHDRRFFGA